MYYTTFIPDVPERKHGYTIDHLFPKTQGFSLSGNAVLACRKCNAVKSDRMPSTTEIVKAWHLYNNAVIPFIASIVFP